MISLNLGKGPSFTNGVLLHCMYLWTSLLTIIIAVNFKSLLFNFKELALTFIAIMFRFEKQIFEKIHLGHFIFFLLKYFEKGTLSPYHI